MTPTDSTSTTNQPLELDDLACKAFMIFMRGETAYCREKWKKIERACRGYSRQLDFLITDGKAKKRPNTGNWKIQNGKFVDVQTTKPEALPDNQGH